MRLNNTSKGLMLNRNWILNFKDTNNIQQAEGRASSYVRPVLLFSQEPYTCLCKAGPVINNQEKVAACLDPNQCRVRADQLAPEPYLSLFQTTTPSQSGYLEAPVLFRDVLELLGKTTRSAYEQYQSFPLILLYCLFGFGNIKFRPKVGGSITEGCGEGEKQQSTT